MREEIARSDREKNKTSGPGVREARINKAIKYNITSYCGWSAGAEALHSRVHWPHKYVAGGGKEVCEGERGMPARNDDDERPTARPNKPGQRPATSPDRQTIRKP